MSLSDVPLPEGPLPCGCGQDTCPGCATASEATECRGLPFRLAGSAILSGEIRAADGCDISDGAVLRGLEEEISVGHHTKVRENAVLVSLPDFPVSVGRKVVVGHSCRIIGGSIGDLSDAGSASLIMPGARLGNRCILGEGAVLPPGMVIPDGHVAAGRPARILRPLSPRDEDMLACMRAGDISIGENRWSQGRFPPGSSGQTVLDGQFSPGRSPDMGKVFSYKGVTPAIGRNSLLMDGAEIIGDVVLGEDCLIGSGVRITGDSHGPVRIGNRVQILENTVLHLLPGCTLTIGDDSIIGPGGMLHGCHIGAGCVIEPAAILCDNSEIGDGCHVMAGSLVRQRAVFPPGSVIDGFPGEISAKAPSPLPFPTWAFQNRDIATIRPVSLKQAAEQPGFGV